MSEEIRKKEAGSKVTPFPIFEEEIQDPETDRLVRESLIREADELEAELNRREDLAGIEAPEGMFQSIVGELKARGIWEEDETEGTESAREISYDGEADAVPGKGSAGEADGVLEKASAEMADVVREESVGEADVVRKEVSAERADAVSEKISAKEVDAVPEGISAGERDTVLEEASVGETDTVSEKISAEKADIVSGTDTAQESSAVHENSSASLESLYAQLPEEDRKALALGREVVQKREKRAEKRRRRRKVLKVSGIVAACLAIVFGVSMTSEANRSLIKKLWDGLLAELAFKLDTNYAGDGETVRSKSKEEIEAVEEIKEKTGAPLIEFGYLPEGMDYQGYEIDEFSFETIMFYSYQEKIFSITIVNIDTEGVYSYASDRETVFLEKITNDAHIDAEIWETNRDLEEETYIAEIEHKGWRYILNGMLPLEEMRKIIKSILIV